ncbi:hypothetical protein [Methanobrevibacter sp.]
MDIVVDGLDYGLQMDLWMDVWTDGLYPIKGTPCVFEIQGQIELLFLGCP